MTLSELLKIMPKAGSKRASLFVGPLNRAMKDRKITTPARQAAFLAQLAHESGQLLYTRELASGQAYEGRRDLGNFERGDGPRFRGRGLIQITGRANYRACSIALYNDERLLANPELLETPEAAAQSAAWFWAANSLNDLADHGNFAAITRRINGGTNGAEERLAFYQVAQRVFV